MARSFGLVDYKVQEAEFFYGQILEADLNFFSVQCNSTAFVSSVRSITFAMQSSLKGTDSFDTWYEQRQDEMRKDSLCKFFNDFRRVSQHIGENLVGGGSCGPNQKTLYYFIPVPDLPNVPNLDVVSASEYYFRKVLQLVYDCYIEFGPIIDGQQRFTQKYFDSIGKTIEDAEEELGFPRGWTDIGDPEAMPWRWETIRRQADGCNIEDIFWSWLELTLPREEPLPAYRGKKH